MTGAEEELLTNQKLIRSGDAVNQVLANCILRIGESDDITTKHVLEMLSGDRLFVLVKLRQIDTTIECDCDSCGSRIRTRLEAEPSFLFPGVRL